MAFALCDTSNNVRFVLELEGQSWLLKILDSQELECAEPAERMVIEKWIMDVEEEIQGNNFSAESHPSDVFQVVVDTYIANFAESKISLESSE